MKYWIIAFIYFSVLINDSFGQTTSLLKLGDKAPPLSVFKWLKGTPIKEWSPNKTYLIEFGATWCSPCAAAIPELTALQRRFQNDLIVISLFVMERNSESLATTNPSYVSNVERYLKRKADLIDYTVGIDSPGKDLENKWLRNAGLSGIPHVFVIDRSGIVSWIGSNLSEAGRVIEEINSRNFVISKTQEKDRVKYDRSKLLLIDNNGGEEGNFIFRSILTYYDGNISDANTEYVQNFYWRKPDSLYDQYEDRFEVIGAPLVKLYYMAYADTLSNVVQFRNYHREYSDTIQNPYRKTSYGKYWHEPILEVTDVRPFEFNWNQTRHRYNYSLKVPKGTGTAAFLQAAFQRDLATYFGYYATVETRIMPYWKLSTTDNAYALSKLRSKDQSAKTIILDREMPYVFKNGEIRDLIMLLASTYGYGTMDYGRMPREEQAAFIDKTGITEKIDFTFDRNMSFDQMKTFLRERGLILSKDFKPMKVVVIRDSTKP